MSGHNSYAGCRYCDLQGIYNNHVYYPTTPPLDKAGKSYNPLDLPIRTHKDFKERIEQIENTLPSSLHRKLASKLGKNINHKLIFFVIIQKLIIF